MTTRHRFRKGMRQAIKMTALVVAVPISHTERPLGKSWIAKITRHRQLQRKMTFSRLLLSSEVGPRYAGINEAVAATKMMERSAAFVPTWLGLGFGFGFGFGFGLGLACTPWPGTSLTPQP